METPTLSPSAAPALTRVPSSLTLWVITFGGCAAAACTFVIALSSDHVPQPVVHASLLSWITLPYILSGVVAWSRRPDSRFGPLLVFAGFATFLSSLAASSVDALFTIGQAFDFVPPVLFLHVFLAFPSGRLQRSSERALVAAAYFVALGLQLLVMVLGGFGSDTLLSVVFQPSAAGKVQQFQLVAISGFALIGIAVLAIRRRQASRPLRRSLALLIDSFALGLVMIAVLFMSHFFKGPAIEQIRWATFAIIGIAPIAFLIGLLDARLARSAVGDLLIELRARPAPPDLRDALANALRDPSLTLAYWLPDFQCYADSEGRPVELPQGEGRATTPIDRDGDHVAVLLHDRSLHEEPELLEAVGAAAGIALENGRLQAELRARLEELSDSRARVIEAGQKERQRLERNLHDGAQQRLVALSLELSMLEERLDPDPEAKVRLDQARREIALSLAELRDIARGLHPAVVSSHGLAVALESLAAHGPVPLRLTIGLENRLPEQVEVAAYYVVLESVANIGKYAHASSGTVDVARTNGVAIVEITDDGVGGADTERGSGLRGLADRVEALGGTLRVWSPRGGGTRVRAEIPCA